MTRIYSDIDAEILTGELGEKKVYIYDGNSRYDPNLILPNLLAVKRLRDYLDGIVKKNKDYYEILRMEKPLQKSQRMAMPKMQLG